MSCVKKQLIGCWVLFFFKKMGDKMQTSSELEKQAMAAMPPKSDLFPISAVKPCFSSRMQKSEAALEKKKLFLHLSY